MAMPFSSLAFLMLSIVFFQLAAGLQAVLVPVRAELEGFSTQAIGLIGTSYYFGFVIGCVLVPAFVRRVGHIRAFAGLASLGAAGFLMHELFLNVPVWLLLRALVGLCFSGLYVVIESWLNDRATPETRGRVLAAYVIICWFAMIGGQLLFMWSDPKSFQPFALITIGFCLAVAPVALTSGAAPKPPVQTRLGVRELYAISPVGLVGCFFVGMANSAFWSLAPIYAQSRGLSVSDIALFMGAAVLGGAISQWPFGWWSDKMDRRRVIGIACVAAVGVAAGLFLQRGSDELMALVLALLFGLCALPLYSLCVAHANDKAPSGSFVEASSGLLMVFGFGAVAGPYLSALLMEIAGEPALFLFTGGAHMALAIFVLLRIAKGVPAPKTEKPAFVAVPPTTQAVLPLAGEKAQAAR